MTLLNEDAFIETAVQFINNLRGPNHGTVGPDQNLVTECGLDSLQLISLMRYVEQLRGDELLDVPDIGDLTLRTAYRLLYIGESSAV